MIFKARKNDRTPLPRPHRWQNRFGYQNDRDWVTTFDHVVNVLFDFGNNWRRTDNREEATLRFFSDNRRRWLDGGPDPVSQQERRYDPINHVWYMGDVAALDYGQAVGSDGIPGSGQFPHFHPNARQHTRRENPRRYVIDISNNAWNGFHDWDQVLGSRGARFNNVTINDIISGSMTRLYVQNSCGLQSLKCSHPITTPTAAVFIGSCYHTHQLISKQWRSFENYVQFPLTWGTLGYSTKSCTAPPPYYLDDIPLQFPNGTSETSSWEAVMSCKKGDAHRNAESIALLGLWAALADTLRQGRSSGGSVDRAWGVIPGAWEDAKNDFDDDELEEEERGGVSTWTEKWTLHLPYAGNRINRAARGDIRGYLDITGRRS